MLASTRTGDFALLVLPEQLRMWLLGATIIALTGSSSDRLALKGERNKDAHTHTHSLTLTHSLYLVLSKAWKSGIVRYHRRLACTKTTEYLERATSDYDEDDYDDCYCYFYDTTDEWFLVNHNFRISWIGSNSRT